MANCYNTDCERVLIRSDRICDCNIATVCAEFSSSPRGKDETGRNSEFKFMVSGMGGEEYKVFFLLYNRTSGSPMSTVCNYKLKINSTCL